MKTKHCGNCKSFIPSIDGFGACTEPTSIYGVHCNNEACSLFKMKSNNGWIEITPDNVDEVDCIDQEKVVVGWLDNKGRQHIAALVDCPPVKSSLAGKGYYYYVLPELKIE